MNKIALQVATFSGALSCFGSVNATEPRTPLVPLPSIDDFTDGDGWGVGLGLGVEYETAYEGSDEFELEIDPAGGVQWRTGDHIFFWAGEAIGWRALAKDAWLLQASVGYEEGREEDDSDEGDEGDDDDIFDFMGIGDGAGLIDDLLGFGNAQPVGPRHLGQGAALVQDAAALKVATLSNTKKLTDQTSTIATEQRSDLVWGPSEVVAFLALAPRSDTVGVRR